MKSGLHLLLVFGVLALVAGSQSAEAAAGIRWYNDPQGAICAQVDSSGNFIQQLPFDVCIKKIGAKTDWRDVPKGVICAEVTPEGFVIQETDDKYCYKSPGAKAVWKNSPMGVRCAEVTPKGSVLMWLDDESFCLKAQGKKPKTVVVPVAPPITPVDPGSMPDDGTGNTTDSGTVVITPKTPGYHWHDLSKGVCVYYDETGRASKMAPPLMCDGNH